MAITIPNLIFRAFDSNGNTVPGALLYAFAAGTETPVDVFSDADLSVVHAHPIVANAAGVFAPIYAQAGDYKIRVTFPISSGGATLYEIDNYSLEEGGVPSTQWDAFAVTKTADYAVQASDKNGVILVDASGPGNINVTSDSATLGNGFPFWVINVGSTGTVTLAGTGGQTVDGSSTLVIDKQNAGVGITSVGAGGWRVFTNTGGIITGALTVGGASTFNGSATFNKAVKFTAQTLTDAATIAWDMSAAPDAQVTITASRTMGLPTNFSAGMEGNLTVIQNGTGGYGITWNGAFLFAHDDDKLVRRRANEYTVYRFKCVDGSTIRIWKVRPMGAVPDLYVRDEKTSGTDGGSVTGGTDHVRVLNTVVRNAIAGASLGSNRITLPAGVYFFRWRAPVYSTGNHQTFLYNQSDSTEVARGATMYARSSYDACNDSCGMATVTITAAKAFELRHRCASSQSTNGFGLAAGFGTEVYSEVEVFKIA